MTASSKRNMQLAGTISVSSRRVAVLGLFVLLLVPAVVIFCHQWRTSRTAIEDKAVAESEMVLPSKVVFHSQVWRASLKPSANIRTGGFPLYNLDNPFYAAGGGEMLAGQDDPFLLALSSGVTEGVLVVTGKSGRVPILGPLLPGRRPLSYSDREVLLAIQMAAGGPFRKFYAALFGNELGELTEIQNADNAKEENPFSHAKEALSEKNAGENTEPPAPSKADPKPETETTHSNNTVETAQPSEPAQPAAPSPQRPHLMLRIGDDGALRAMTASAPREGTFETVEIGTGDFSVLPFSDTPEFPIALTVADFNGDGYPDVAADAAPQGQLRFFYGSADGTYTEGLRIEIGVGPRSLAAGDFDRNGRMDIAVSPMGTGAVVVLFSNPEGLYRFKTFWIDAYRDYITVADTTGTGVLDLVGIDYAGKGTVLVDFSQPDGNVSGKSFDYTPALDSQIFTSKGRSVRLSATALTSNLALSLDNRMNQLINVLNVAAGTNLYVVVGDMAKNDHLSVVLATPRR